MSESAVTAGFTEKFGTGKRLKLSLKQFALHLNRLP